MEGGDGSGRDSFLLLLLSLRSPSLSLSPSMSTDCTRWFLPFPNRVIQSFLVKTTLHTMTH